ncbi:hypothetical protein CDCA_CDCA01G0258 [Cyanidium caldarium]|uniref:Uncharacterized protein n=1 Tax=Cyanidium caldarium TaxID=2771 RepID=A0AAV9IQD2_CYACA|nr:hypothetical protein CDCA_CDCA01G0258 [Cyanidium caldarium]
MNAQRTPSPRMRRRLATPSGFVAEVCLGHFHAPSTSRFAALDSAPIRRPLHRWRVVRLRPARITGGQRYAVRMEMDSTAVIAVAAAVGGLAAGIGLIVFTERQGLRGKERGSSRKCVDCRGAGRVACGFCRGSGLIGFDEDNMQTCTYCDGKGTIVCKNCEGSGAQPQYLDRLSPEDFMD